MDRREREMERKYHSGEVSEGEYFLHRLNQNVRMGIRPVQGTIMSTPAGVVYFNGDQWEVKAPAPPSAPTLHASGAISWTPIPTGGNGDLMVASGSSWAWINPASFDFGHWASIFPSGHREI